MAGSMRTFGTDRLTDIKRKSWSHLMYDMTKNGNTDWRTDGPDFIGPTRRPASSRAGPKRIVDLYLWERTGRETCQTTHSNSYHTLGNNFSERPDDVSELTCDEKALCP